MNIKRAKQEIKDTVAAYLAKDEFGAYEIPSIRQRPMLLIGPPGIGKTQIMEQVAQECQIGLVAYTITHHTRQSAVGLPFIEHKMYGGKEYAVTEYTMSEIVASIYDRMEKSGMPEGILFIDEINCVSETLAPTMLQFLQGKAFGNHKIPEGWIIVAAGNPPEYNKSVREFDIVTMDRIRRMDVEPDLPVWKEYAKTAGVHPSILSYLNVRPQNFCQIETTVDGRRFVTPRGWEDLSELIRIYEKQERKMDRELVGEYIQFPKIAKDFANYLELYYKYRNDYQVEQVLEGHISEAAVDKLQRASFDERISVVSLLLSGLNEKFRNVIRMEEMMSLRMEQMKKLQSGDGTASMPGAARADAGQAVPETAVDGAQKNAVPETAAAETHEQADANARTGNALVDVLSALTDNFRSEWSRLLENSLLSRGQLRTYRAVSAKLEEDLMELRKSGITDWNEGFALLRERFGADSDRYEELFDEAGEALEHAFDFMEAAFAGSQELVLFVTELNTGAYSVHFLQDYECERYYQYNRDLLFSQEEEEILRSMNCNEALLNKRG